MNLQQKLTKLKLLLMEMKTVVIAYSGGIDSTFLLKVAVDTLGKNAIGITCDSEIISKKELTDAKHFAKLIGADHDTIYIDLFKNKKFVSNCQERCYYCKRELLVNLLAYAKNNGYQFVIDGANVDDRDDYRPGSKAVVELAVRSPLQEANFTKEDIRLMSKQLGLPNWNKPAQACLASRFPYGDKITIEKINQVAAGEELLKQLGFSQCRLRHHGNTARIEVLPTEFPLILAQETAQKLDMAFKNLGFVYVTLDLSGFRSGSMNDTIRK